MAIGLFFYRIGIICFFTAEKIYTFAPKINHRHEAISSAFNSDFSRSHF